MAQRDPRGVKGTAPASVAVLDLGQELGAVRAAFTEIGVATTAVTSPHEAVDAAGLVLAYDGPFAECMAALRKLQGPRVIGQRLAGSRPVLAWGTGMQVLFDAATTAGGHQPGCGEWPGTVEPFVAGPHRGEAGICKLSSGNGAEVAWSDSAMFAGVNPDARFHFDHELRAGRWELETEITTPPVVAWTRCESAPQTAPAQGSTFVTAVENGSLWGLQFHPERSGEAGLQVLANWVKTLEVG